MARVLVTGSTDGLGRLSARALQRQGHEVVVHVRGPRRLSAVADLVDKGATVVSGDLADDAQVRDLARQVNELGRLDAVIHNAGVDSGGPVMPVNVVAPYLLTALIDRPGRLVYLSSGMHRGGRASSLDGIDFSGGRPSGSYSDSKMFVTALCLAVARRWPDVLANAVDPGWVPTRMGGSSAPDDLELGHVTQDWLAVSDDPAALTSGGYWHHQRRQDPHRSAADTAFQDRLLAVLAAHTGVELPA